MREWGVVCLYDPDENYDEDGEADPGKAYAEARGTSPGEEFAAACGMDPGVDFFKPRRRDPGEGFTAACGTGPGEGFTAARGTGPGEGFAAACGMDPDGGFCETRGTDPTWVRTAGARPTETFGRPGGVPDELETDPEGDAAWWRRLTRALTPSGGTAGDRVRGGSGNRETPSGREQVGGGVLQGAKKPDEGGRSAWEPGAPDAGSGTRPAGPAGEKNDGAGEFRTGSFGRFAAGPPGECPGGEYDYGTEDADGWAFLEALGRMVNWLAATLAASRDTGDPWEAAVLVEAEREPFPVRPPEPPPSWHRPHGPFRGL